MSEQKTDSERIMERIINEGRARHNASPYYLTFARGEFLVKGRCYGQDQVLKALRHGLEQRLIKLFIGTKEIKTANDLKDEYKDVIGAREFVTIEIL